MSESLFADKDGSEKSLLFELSLELMMGPEPAINLNSSKTQSPTKKSDSKKSDEDEISITEAIEEFLASDFEISFDPRAK